MTQLLDHATLELRPEASEIARAAHWVVERTPPNYDRTRLNLGLTEVVTNALVHGVLEIHPADREPHHIASLIAERAVLPHYCTRGIGLEYERSQSSLTIRVCWVGAPRMPSIAPESSIPSQALAGRGTKLISWCFDEVHWDTDGLAVTLRLRPESRGGQE